jgi:hypothetical protein
MSTPQFNSAAYLASIAQRPVGTIRTIATQAGITPAMQINQTEYFSGEGAAAILDRLNHPDDPAGAGPFPPIQS